MRKDQGSRGWVIVASCFCMGAITNGLKHAYGLMFIEFLREFKQSKTKTAWIDALFSGWNILGPVGSILTNKFGCRTVVVFGATLSFVGRLCSVFSTSIQYLCVSYGCVVGFGFLLLTFPKDVVIIQYFEKNRSFAMGISLCGSGIGMIVFNPLTKWLIDEYGWRGTLLIEAGLTLNCVAGGFVMRPFVATLEPPDAIDRKPSGMTPEKASKTTIMDIQPEKIPLKKREILQCPETSKSARWGYKSVFQRFESEVDQNASLKDGTKDFKHLFELGLLRQPTIVIYILSGLFRGISLSSPFTFIPDMAIGKGWSRAQAAWLLTAIGIVNTVCRMPVGKMADMTFVNRTFVTSVSLCLLGIFSTVMPLVDRYDALLSVCVLFGIVYALYVVTCNVVVADLFGDENVTNVYGLIKFISGLGSLISGPLSGALFDSTGDYMLAIATIGASSVLAGILIFALFVMSRRQTTDK